MKIEVVLIKKMLISEMDGIAVEPYYIICSHLAIKVKVITSVISY